MPVYEYICPKGHHFERYLPVSEYKSPQTCSCGEVAEKQISIPMLNCDIQPWDHYISPVSGKPITSYKARKEDMAEHNCVDYEPTMREETKLRAKRSQDALEKKFDATIEKEIHNMPSRKREKLESELTSGAECVYERR